jgi:serine/threonine-protein kinase
MTDVRPGSNQFGPYLVQEKIGGGGMAVVYKALNEETQRVVALKVLRASLMEQPGVIERFKQEAMIANTLRHPHVVAVYNYGSIRERYFLEMQYMPGGTLAQRFAMPTVIGAQEAIRLLRSVASALDYAHRQGVIHRDLKLENILLDGRGNASLTDFGIARISDGSRLTSTGYVVGTPLYIAPEQARGDSGMDHRADLYSLAVIAYVLAVGHFPFSTGNLVAIITAHLTQPVPIPSEINPDLPPAVDSVLLRGLAKRPDDRYSSADTFVEAFARALQDHRTENTQIDLWSAPEDKQLISMLKPPPSESADSLCEKALTTQDRYEAIGYLKKALELEPLHSKANRLLFQIEGAKPFPMSTNTQTPSKLTPAQTLPPLKNMRRERQRNNWSNLYSVAVVVALVSIVLFIMILTHSPITTQLGNMIAGK